MINLRWLAVVLFCLLTAQCANKTHSDHIRILEEIPEEIREVENLTIFPGDSEPLYSINLIREQVYGADGEPWLSKIMRANVDDKGRVIIWDINTDAGGFPPQNNLYVYNSDGNYLTQIGRRGKGPGEFVMLMGMKASNGHVYALDHTSQRLNVYNAEDYSFERSTLVDQWRVHNHEAVQDLGFARLMTRNDGNHLAVFIEKVPVSGRSPVSKFMLIDTDGHVLNHKPLEFPAGFTISPQTTPPTPSMTLPFMGHTVTALSRNNALYSVWTSDFLIKTYDASGVYQSAIYYPVTGSPFDLRDHTESSRYNSRDIRNAFENSEEELPETNPVLADLIVDDENRIWAAVPMDPQQEMYEWWILAPGGELLAKLQRPSTLQIFDIKDGYLFAKEIDEETDAEFIVKYRIGFEEK